MVVLVALRVPALGFCLCQHVVVLDPAGCCESAAHQQPACGCCPADSAAATEPVPCHDDCVVLLSLDPGDFTWSTDRFEPAPQLATPVALSSGFQHDLPPGSSLRDPSGTIRGSPPHGKFPVLLRTQVLRL